MPPKERNLGNEKGLGPEHRFFSVVRDGIDKNFLVIFLNRMTSSKKRAT